MFVLRPCEPGPFGLYVLCEGDSLQSVCAAQGVSYASLIELNGLRAFPPPGSLLLLPPAEETYVVRPEDTAEKICGKFSLDVEAFKQRNHCAFVYPTQRVSVSLERDPL